MICGELLGSRPWKTPSNRRVEVFERTMDARDGPSIKKFRLQLGGERRMTPWNVRAADLFVEEFCRRFSFKGKEKTRATFLTYLIALRRNYEEDRHPLPPAQRKKVAQKNAAEARQRRVLLTHIDMFGWLMLSARSLPVGITLSPRLSKTILSLSAWRSRCGLA